MIQSTWDESVIEVPDIKWDVSDHVYGISTVLVNKLVEFFKLLWKEVDVLLSIV